MLRCTRRIIKPTGRTAFWTIEVSPGLSSEEYAAATEGDIKKQMIQEAPTTAMLDEAGFRVLETRDVTAIDIAVGQRWMAAARRMETELRDALGDVVYEERIEIRTNGLDFLQRGLHRRMFYVAEPQ